MVAGLGILLLLLPELVDDVDDVDDVAEEGVMTVVMGTSGVGTSAAVLGWR